jgi:hypothetical protein
MKETKETMKTFVDNVQPVIQEIKRSHNQFFRLEYFAFSPEDLYEDSGCLEYQSEKKYNPEHFEGPINAVCAQFGEETGAALLLEITPEVRGLLSSGVIDVLCDRGEQGDIEFINAWEKSANETVYFRMDHVYYQSGSGFELSNECDQITPYLGHGLEHIVQRLGLSCLEDTIDNLLYEHGWELA